MTASLREILGHYASGKLRTGQKSKDRFREIERYIEHQERSGASYLTYTSILEWQRIRAKTLGAYSRQESYQMLRKFSTWAHLVDSKNEELPQRKRRVKGRRTPIILASEQVANIIKQMNNTCSTRPLTHHTYCTLVGLLFVTGMRVSEALINLSDDDVNLEERYIYVRASKAARDRYIPIKDSTAMSLRKYRALREKQFPGLTDRFFLVHTGVPKSPNVFQGLFNRATCELGYRSADQVGYDAKSLVPHDLRHSFATNTLHRFHREGLDLKSEIPKLSVTLGHYSVRETYWYIESIPELLAIILRKGANNAR